MKYSLVIGSILIIAVLIAGCSDQSGSGTTTPVPTTIAVQPKFVAGDIIAKTAASTDTFWLIVKYDTKTDKYERALVFKTLQQIWFRKDNRTETAERTLTETIYKAKVFHADSVSAIPYITPTPTTTVTTKPSGPAPYVSGITPNFGTTGSSVSITNIGGRNFQSGVTVKLKDAVGMSITATNVLATDTKITCIINLNGASAGKGDVVVTNPDGQSATLTDGFMINEPGPGISSIDPNEGNVGDNNLPVTITGNNFPVLPKIVRVWLTKQNTGNIDCVSPQSSLTQITCTLVIPKGTPIGKWNLMVRNVNDNLNVTALNIFTINNAT